MSAGGALRIHLGRTAAPGRVGGARAIETSEWPTQMSPGRVEVESAGVGHVVAVVSHVL